MSDVTDAAESLAAAEPAAPTMAEAQATAESGQAEGVTQEEVNAALRSAGINLPAEPVAADDATTDEDTTTAEETSEEDAAGEGTDTEEVANEEPVKPEKPAPTETATTDAPDFSFEVKDANDVTFKITPDANIEDILKEFEPTNNGQIISVLDQLREAKDAQKAYNADQETQAAETARSEQIATIQEGWKQEFKDLGITDENRQSAIYEYMSTENDKRQGAGRPLIASIEDAKLGLEAREAIEAEAQAKKDAKDSARKAGSLVGGGSAAATSGAPAYVAGSARNANEAIRVMNLL